MTLKYCKKLTGLTLAMAMLAGSGFQVNAEAPSLTVDAQSAIIMEAETGEVLFEQNPDERRAPASVTKIMTILLIYDAVDDGRIKWDDIVTVSEHAASMGGSQIFLEPMEQQSVHDLTKSIVIASANDAAVAMAEFIGGSEESFVDMMNKKAKALGMENTQFKNACGLDAEGHFTSARDIALMSGELITKHPEVTDYTTVWMDTITHKTAKGESEFGLTNTNKLVRFYNGATGLKTGSTSEALYCLSGTAMRDDMHLIAVVMASPSPTVRFQEVMTMLDYGFANFKRVEGDEAGTVLGSIEVAKGKVDLADAAVAETVGKVTAKGNAGEIESEIMLYDNIEAPAEAGMVCGEVIYTYDGEEIGRCDLVLTEDIERAGMGDTVRKLLQLWGK